MLGFGREGPRTATPVQQLELRTVVCPEPLGDFEESAIDQRAVIVGDVDEPGFLYQAAELDQMPCALSSCHNPGPRVRSCSCGLKPVPRLPIPSCRPCQRQQHRATIAGLFPERTARRAHSMST